MNEWEQAFGRKMEAIREQSFVYFDRLADEVIEPAFRRVADFVAKWNFQTSMNRSNEGQRSFKFALNENDYLLVLFRFEGVDTVESDYECCVGGKGRIAGQRTGSGLRNADQQWAESCFQSALDNFVGMLAKGAEVGQEMAEAAVS
ncbi:MAG: hypothetical protein JSV03_08440 [Planctomycetota bacterium]|nr:MAG: hypothetical protein JSV03_08440 [Planctomycetota bacterium]